MRCFRSIRSRRTSASTTRSSTSGYRPTSSRACSTSSPRNRKGSQPTEPSADYANFTINSKIGRYAVGLNADQYNNDLLGGATDTFNGAYRQSGHPFDMQLNVNSFEDEFRFFRYVGVPLKFQYRAGYGYDYDSYGLPTLGPGAANIPSTGAASIQFDVQHVSGRDALHQLGPAREARDDLGQSRRAGNVVHDAAPHDHDQHVDHARLYAALDETAGVLVDVSDPQRRRFLGCRSTMAYPAAQDTRPLPASERSRASRPSTASRRRATCRGRWPYTPTPYFALNLTMQHFDVTPAPVPGLGGQAPDQLVADVRMRLSRNILADISRGYFFNWANETWAPQYGIQFSP